MYTVWWIFLPTYTYVITIQIKICISSTPTLPLCLLPVSPEIIASLILSPSISFSWSQRPYGWNHVVCAIWFLSVHSTFCIFFLNLFIYLYLFLAVLGLRFCAGASSSCGSGGHSSSRCAGLSPSRPLLLWSTGSRRAGSVVVAHGLSRSAACGIFPDQGSNPCPLHWQADS